MIQETPATIEQPAKTDLIELHPDYLPEPEFFDDDHGDEDAAPDPVDDDGKDG